MVTFAVTKLIIQAAHPIEGSLLTFVCCWGNKLHSRGGLISAEAAAQRHICCN